MNERAREVLMDLGFEPREINIYLTLIKNQSLTALQISKETRIDRTTIYDILERLMDKGIVSSTIKNKTKYFSALTPKELLTYFKEQYSSLETILPELNKLAIQTKESIKCELFQGRKGILTVLKELIAAKKDHKTINIRKEFEDVVGYFIEQGVIRLAQWGIREKGIVLRDAEFTKLKHGTYRYVDGLNSPVTTLIQGDNVLFAIWIEPCFIIRINNKTFAQAQEEYFDFLWDIAKE